MLLHKKIQQAIRVSRGSETSTKYFSFTPAHLNDALDFIYPSTDGVSLRSKTARIPAPAAEAKAPGPAAGPAKDSLKRPASSSVDAAAVTIQHKKVAVTVDVAVVFSCRGVRVRGGSISSSD